MPYSIQFWDPPFPCAGVRQLQPRGKVPPLQRFAAPLHLRCSPILIYVGYFFEVLQLPLGSKHVSWAFSQILQLFLLPPPQHLRLFLTDPTARRPCAFVNVFFVFCDVVRRAGRETPSCGPHGGGKRFWWGGGEPAERRPPPVSPSTRGQACVHPGTSRRDLPRGGSRRGQRWIVHARTMGARRPPRAPPRHPPPPPSTRRRRGAARRGRGCGCGPATSAP